ncbi:MAG: oligoendopeptidase F, partial [Oscillospiraceae bacterium]|nr:oligoendopeptidase F [Oscillospiraceae bacterium]
MPVSEHIPQRSDIPQEHKWDLEALYQDVDAWQSDLARLRAFADESASYAGRICADPSALLAYMRLSEEACDLADRLGNYAMRKCDEDTRISENQSLRSQYTKAAVEFGQKNSFMKPELLSVDDEQMEAFYKAELDLERYRLHFDRIRRKRAHTLPPEQEKLLAMAGEMARAPGEIYSLFSDADLSFPDALGKDGNVHPISQGSFISCMESTDRTLRKDAYEKYYGVYSQFRNTSAGLLAAQVRKLQFFSDARHYDSPLAASLDQTDVPVDVYHTLIEAVHRHLDKLQRYIAMRKRMLGLDELHFYDMYTPLTGKDGAKYPFEDAKSIVLEALSCMGDAYTDILREGFDNRWIDIYENVGKRSGAYSAGTPVHPYVLLNYKPNLDGVFTLAHEMGHAIHSYLSYKAQPTVYADYEIFVAEVASTCNEALVMEHLRKITTEKEAKMRLLNYFLEQFKSTLYRQAMFAEYELKIAELNQNGTPLTADVLMQTYRELNHLYFGDGIVLDEQIALEWARIPHFYYNYYVFQYATGYAAAIALSQQILTEGAPAVARYIRFLQGGCSASPTELLRLAGVDMTTGKPIDEALELFGRL